MECPACDFTSEDPETGSSFKKVFPGVHSCQTAKTLVDYMLPDVKGYGVFPNKHDVTQQASELDRIPCQLAFTTVLCANNESVWEFILFT